MRSKRFLLIFCIALCLAFMCSCVPKPVVESETEWEGKDTFEIPEYEDSGLEKRYNEYAENAGLAFKTIDVADESLFEVEDYGDGVKLTSYSGSEGIIVVPDKVSGKTVLALGAQVFAKSLVKAVCLPDSIVMIEEGAFAECNNLTTLKIPFIGDGADVKLFGYIFGADSYDQHALKIPPSLDMVIVGEKQGEIGENAFAGCKSLSAVILPEQVNKICKFAFYECRDLVYLSYDSSNIIIEDYAFAYCSSLYSFASDNCEQIGLGAFYECTSLEKLALPFVGGSADENCFLGYIFGAETPDYNDEFVPKSLRSFTLTKAEAVPDRAFAGCKYISEINLPVGTEKIGVRAFYSCRSIVEMSLPDTVVSVGDDAFFGCDNLKSIELGKGLVSIGMQAFFGCRALETVSIPEGVTEIKASTFAYCKDLKTVTLNNVKKVGKEAFRACDNLESVDCTGIDVAEGNAALTGEDESESASE